MSRDETRPIDQPGGPGQNTGHGHVYRRPDGSRARCGGPRICSLCRDDAARKQSQEAAARIAWLPIVLAYLEENGVAADSLLIQLGAAGLLAVPADTSGGAA